MRSRSPARPRRASQTLAPERQRALSTLFNGDFLEGLEIDRSPAFNGWLTAQRRRFRGCHAALLEQLARSAPDDEAFGYLEKWLQLAPFDRRVHEILLAALARRGRIREGEEHLAATARLFEAEGLDCAPLRDAWRSARAQGAGPPRPAPPRRSSTGGSRRRPRRRRRRCAAPRLDRGDAVRRPVRRDGARAAALPTRSPTT